MSDINLTYSNISRHNLMKEGIKNDYIIKVGSPLFEVFLIKTKIKVECFRKNMN